MVNNLKLTKNVFFQGFLDKIYVEYLTLSKAPVTHSLLLSETGIQINADHRNSNIWEDSQHAGRHYWMTSLVGCSASSD
jgi:hypothetical protein